VKEVAKPVEKPVEKPEPTPPKVSSASAEQEYVGKVRNQLNAIKRYPTSRSASEQRPRGAVTLWFTLNRDGSVADSGIDESSNSQDLDNEARKTLNRATFPSFPDGSWAGESTHRFTAKLDFAPK
jgi:protein TonB